MAMGPFPDTCCVDVCHLFKEIFECEKRLCIWPSLERIHTDDRAHCNYPGDVSVVEMFVHMSLKLDLIFISCLTTQHPEPTCIGALIALMLRCQAELGTRKHGFTYCRISKTAKNVGNGHCLAKNGNHY